MSDALLGKAVLELVTDGAALEKGLDSAKAKAEGWSEHVSGVAKGAALAIAGVGAAAGAIIGTMVAAAHAVAIEAGEVAKLRRETGLTTAEVSKLKYAGDRFNIGTDDLSKSLGILSKSLESTHPSLEKYDIDIVKAKDGHIDMERTLGNVADRFKAMPDGVEKTALALDIFGKSGKDMIPLLNQGSDGLKAMGDEAAKLGLVFDDKTLASAKRLSMAQKDLDDRLAGLRNRIGVDFLPILADWTGGLVKLADVVLPPVIGGLQTITTVVGNVLKPIGELRDILKGTLAPEAWSINRLIGEDRGAQVIGVLQHVRVAIAEIPGLIGAVAGSIGEIFDVATGRRPDAGGVLRSLVGDDKAEAIMGTVGRVRDAMTTAFDIVKPVIKGIIDQVIELKTRFDDLPPAIQGIAAAIAVGQFSGFNDWLLSVAANAVQAGQGLVAVGRSIGGLGLAMSVVGLDGFVLQLMYLGDGIAAAAAGVGPFLIAFGPITLLFAAVGVAIYLLITHWDELGDTMHMIGTIVHHFVDEAGQSISDFLAFWSGVWNEVSSKPSYYLGLALGFVIGGLLNISKAIGDFAVGAVQTVVTWLSDSKVNIWNFFTDLPGHFFQFAVDAVHGLANGFGSMVGWIRDQIGGFMNGVLDGVREALGWPHSPAPALVPLGESIMTGLAEGISNDVEVPENLLLGSLRGTLSRAADMVNQMLGGMTSSALAYGLPAGSNPNTGSWMMPDVHDAIAQTNAYNLAHPNDYAHPNTGSWMMPDVHDAIAQTNAFNREPHTHPIVLNGLEIAQAVNEQNMDDLHMRGGI